jgi:hypothetical protein
VRMFSLTCASPADATIQMLTAAALEESNLIVLGTATAHGLDRLLHGDVADALVTHARCSLLVVPATVRTCLADRDASTHALAARQRLSASRTGRCAP